MELDVFAKMISEKRNALGLSMADVSEKTGIAVDLLEKYEAGIQKPKARDLKSLGKALDIPPVILMHGPCTAHYSNIDENGHKISKWKKY
ncbi:XRE family transcriptional regulator [Butyrivibrio sp. X503]|uniref:helix-turn-helix domain-containing protein n=1 Tax=unclassified Butyrivibrio TaxID=2639466 RepID=UPI000EA8FE8B|nr:MULTISPECIES: helix-turn-helix transcriptional regulator [unclassified Butyrivibrio]RKM56237.1 XRE family transcriptional regulator [Butyrivibrio sp. X503]RKM58665.1 XRE family transcriptional regulator [Butyrivibrio sp. XB500-5]